MKLRNKKTGEVDDYIFEVITDRIDLYKRVGYSDNKNVWQYNSLAELYENWEDYEPKEYWVIDWGCRDRLNTFTENNDDIDTFNKSIGNYFNSREEAEKAIENLKAWKRLKDDGFKAIEKKICGDYVDITFIFNYPVTNHDKSDLDLLFGGEKIMDIEKLKKQLQEAFDREGEGE